MPIASDLPVMAEVITKRVPNAYDPTALALKVRFSNTAQLC